MESKLEWLFWTWSPYINTTVKKRHGDLRECMCNVLLWIDLPRLGGLRLHQMYHQKDMRANYAACYSSKQDIASLSGWSGLF